ncbi:hypothetical protein L228DRAFT_283684 [Xylona heveae TC161]|uniref:Saccharopine dehydrogenase NADP binding domain-containing protein n=1 Tax=Xylona heveae (strain CBS 132557 / TC161) TaxID=1328760 RepID=A0A165FYH3_XYLHT|nr:hypothetical protein L228DRAFT_283684 [Xylona heveae TC161]KZF21533.1 hypothetical protein L228DRAFT_283684 [Xylona heveae TC161]
MEIASQDRVYELVLFGATGYTGQKCAEHITTHLPSNLKWAIAGRSASKLEALASRLSTLNPDRVQPDIQVTELKREDLDSLARKTKLVINTVGPYHIYGTPVVEACAINGTHYLDVTGESVWVLEIVQKYHEKAKASGAIIIPEIGIESAPADLLTWSLATVIREHASASLKELIYSLHSISGSLSGGTLSTILNLADRYSVTELHEATKPWALSPVPGHPSSHAPSLTERILGVRYVPDLGVLTTSPQGTADRVIVHRSWGLMGGGSFYGPKFYFSGYMRTRNTITGAIIRIAFALGFFCLLFPPIRWLLKRLVYEPGQGDSRDVSARDHIEYRAMGIADQADPNPQRAIARMRYDGGNYHVSGIFLAQAAITILREDTLAKKLGGGILTPATLGQAFIDNLKKAGVTFETRVLPH